MPVTVSAKVLSNSVKALRELSALEVPIKLGFKLKRVLKKVQTEVDMVIETKKEITDKCVEKDENGKPVVFTDATGKPVPGMSRLKDSEGYTAAIEELEKEEIVIDIEPLDEKEFGENLKMTGGALLAIDWLFKE